jgi:predicted NBD/HSP70 family sugar kinase
MNDADAAIAAEVWGNNTKAIYEKSKNIAMITIGTGNSVSCD